jgi:hypothetical protein
LIFADPLRLSGVFPAFNQLNAVMPGRPLQKDCAFFRLGCRNLFRRDRFARVRHIFLHHALGIERRSLSAIPSDLWVAGQIAAPELAEVG